MAAGSQPSNRFIITKLWDDPEIGGRLYLQACHLNAQSLLGTDSSTFFTTLAGVMHKLSATKYHLRNYGQLESKLFSQAVRSFKACPDKTREAFELIFEMEAFIFQIKSSLDLMVKIINPIIGENLVNTQTFGAKGDKLVKGLQQYARKTNANQEAVAELIRLIETDKDSWLSAIISIRDELNHRSGLNNFKFLPLKLPNGQITARKPRFRNGDALSFMRLAYQNNLEFHQDFMCCCLRLRLPHALHLAAADPNLCRKHFPADAAKFIKYQWAISLQGSGGSSHATSDKP